MQLKMKRKQLEILVALAIPSIPFMASAQTADTAQTLPTVQVQESRDAGPAYNPASSSTATKIAAPLRDIPQTVNVVPQQVIRDKNATSLEGVLATVPGVTLSHGDGQRDQVFIRGFTAIGDQFVDGLRDDGLYFRDLSNIERVEVVKGPASVLYGRGSSGGMINRITKKPGVDVSEVTGTVGSWGQRRGEFDLGRNLNETVSLRVTGAKEKADSYRDQQFLDRETIASSLLFKLAPKTSLLLQADYLRDKRVTDFGIPAYQGRPVAVSPSTYYGAANAAAVDTSESTVDSVGFTFDHKFNDGLSFKNAFRRYQYTLVRNNTLVGAVNEPALTARLDHTNVLRSEDGYFNQSELTQKLSLAGMQHQLLYGLEIGKQNKDQYFITQTGVGTVNLFNPVLPVVNLTAVNPAGPSTNNTGILKTSSVYVQDLVSLTKNWKALAGLRYDRFDQEMQNRIPGAANLSRTDNNWSPRAGVVYQPRLDQSYYASVSKSFQPSAEVFPLAANNSQIAPEQTTNYEVGAKLDYFDGNASLNAALFNLQRTNMKFATPAGVVVPIGTQRSRGMELSFTGQLPQGWNIWSGYTFMNTRVTDSVAIDSGVPVEGKQATLTPRHSASAWLTKALGNGWRAGAGVTYVGDRFANPGNTVTLPAYTKFDAMVGYKLAKLDLQLNLNNLLNRGYIVSGHGTSPNLNLPGAPRNAQLTARYNF